MKKGKNWQEPGPIFLASEEAVAQQSADGSWRVDYLQGINIAESHQSDSREQAEAVARAYNSQRRRK